VSYCCPDCGSEVVTSGRCFVCYSCGCEGCGVARLEVVNDGQTHLGGSTDTARGLEAKDVSMPSRVLDYRSGEKS
jgi:hypothetical protein